MSNLTFDHRLLKEHTPEPLEGHAVVVFERVGAAGEVFHSVLTPGRTPIKPGLALPLRKRPEYFAYAVDISLERHLEFSGNVRFADHASEVRVIFDLAYAVSDAATLARTRNSDPLRGVRDHVRSVVEREVEQLPWQTLGKTFPQHARTIVDGCVDELSTFARQYGLAVRGLRLAARLPESMEVDPSSLQNAMLERGVGRMQDLARIEAALINSDSIEEILQRLRVLERPADGGLESTRQGGPAAGLGSAGRSLSRPETRDVSNVLLGGSAPGRAQPGDTVLVQFAAYIAAFKRHVRQLLNREAGSDTVHMDEPAQCQWAAGARVSVRCRANGLVVPTPVQHFTWDGGWRTVSFDVEVPEDARFKSTVVVLEAFIHDGDDAVQVAALRMPLHLARPSTRRPRARWVHSRAARKAFASYASQDRADVLARVSSIARSTGMDIFVDRTSLRMGEEWEPALLAHIAESERFLLFWSEFAAQSAWVRREMDEAIAAHGEDVLELHLLRHVPADSIPERLRKFHFDDRYLLARDGDLHREHAASPPDD